MKRDGVYRFNLQFPADTGRRFSGNPQKIRQKRHRQIHIDLNSLLGRDAKIPCQLPEFGGKFSLQINTANSIFQLMSQPPEFPFLIPEQILRQGEVLFHQLHHSVFSDHKETAFLQRFTEDRIKVRHKALIGDIMLSQYK